MNLFFCFVASKKQSLSRKEKGKVYKMDLNLMGSRSKKRWKKARIWRDGSVVTKSL